MFVPALFPNVRLAGAVAGPARAIAVPCGASGAAKLGRHPKQEPGTPECRGGATVELKRTS